MGSFALGLVWLFAGYLTVEPGTACPSVGAIDAELERLGARAALAQMGTAEVHVREPVLQIVLRDQQGRSLGAREVAVTADCRSRATLAAVMIAAWAGEWRETRLGAPALPSTAIAGAQPESAAPASPVEPWAVALGVDAFGLHDGDQAAGGAGASLEAARGHLLLAAMFEATTERERALGPGVAGYRSLGGGLGLGGRARWNRLFLDGMFAPLLSRRYLQGKNLQANYHVSSWAVSLTARARLGWSGPLLTPYLFADISRDTPRQEATLDDRADVLRLSPTNVALGLGLLFHLRP